MDTRKAAMQVGSICLKVAVFVLVVLGIVYLGQMTYHYSYAVFCDAPVEDTPGKSVWLQLEEDASAKNLAKALEQKGLVEDAKIFYLQMKISSCENTVKAGTYELNTSMAPSEMFEILFGENEDEK